MKKYYLFLILVLAIFFLAACQQKLTDSENFKVEYENLNGTVNESNGKYYRSIDINIDNPFVYSTAEKIATKIENKETFIVYFGFAKCPWCRSVLPTLLEVFKSNDIKIAYYVDVLNIRDTKQLDDNGKVETITEGTLGYYKLLNLLDDVLKDYTVDGNSMQEKRIYAPNIVVVKEGKPLAIETGISDLQKDAYMNLTKQMKDETYNKFDKIIKLITENDKICVDKEC